MRNRHLHLYVSTSTWLAMAGHSAPAPPGRHDGLHAGADPQGCDALARALRQQFPKGRKVSLVLSARLCRFVVLPWLSTGGSAGGIRARVQAAFVAEGADPASHHVEIQWPPHGAPILAVAYPRMVVEALDKALLAAGWAVQDVRASIAPILAKYGSRLGIGPQLLAYAEDDGITGISLEGGEVVQVETLSGSDCGLDDVAVWAARKRFAFPEVGALRWLPTGPSPSPFGGEPLSLCGVGAPVSPGHAVVAACA